MKAVRYTIEAILLYFFYGVFAVLPLDVASGFGGWIGRTLGPLTGANKKALKNLKRAFPDKSDNEYQTILTEMWDNLGRVFAEYPHLRKIGTERVEIINGELIEKAKDQNKGGIFCASHSANWEVNSSYLYLKHNIALRLTYRALNNPMSDGLLRRARTLNDTLPAFPKSRESGKHILQTLKDKQYLAMMMDQKYNEGVAVPFFGHPAMTSPIIFQLAQKYKCPLIMVQNTRTKGAHFKTILSQPLDLFDKDDNSLPIEDVIAQAHHHLENWIKENPGQWLWTHRRWDSQKLLDQEREGITQTQGLEHEHQTL